MVSHSTRPTQPLPLPDGPLILGTMDGDYYCLSAEELPSGFVRARLMSTPEYLRVYDQRARLRCRHPIFSESTPRNILVRASRVTAVVSLAYLFPTAADREAESSGQDTESR